MRDKESEKEARKKTLVDINFKKLLDEVFAISTIINVEVGVTNRSRRLIT